MSDKRKQKLRTHLRPSLHDEILTELNAILEPRRGQPRVDYLLSNMLSKYVGPDTDPLEVRHDRAIEKWLGQEQRNRKTNARLLLDEADFGWPLARSKYELWEPSYIGDHSGERLTITSEAIIHVARGLVIKVIGEEPPHVNTVLGSFTGGASTSLRRDTGNVARKFMGQADVTPAAWPWIIPMVIGSTGWTAYNQEVKFPDRVYGNILFTVPKSTMINRVAAKEPDLNMFAQTAYGNHIAKRLKRFGIDLNDQSINRNLARLGSIDGSLATIDLSSASDSVSTQLVARLLPPGWFVLLNALRSQHTLIGKDWHENQMFSSMGNGFTFPLETLIFFCLAWALSLLSGVKGRISVYGDDIICPTKLAPMLMQSFLFFGFKINRSKSFTKGRIRESCGGHYYRGADITPFYIKDPINTLDRLIHFLNRLRKWAGLEDNGRICDPDFFPLWQKYAKMVDSRLYGGDDYGDKSRLVTKHNPRFKLIEHTREPHRLVEQLQLGLYLQALSDLASQRGGAGPVTYDPNPPILYHKYRGPRIRNALANAVSWVKDPSSSFKAESSSLSVPTGDWVIRRVEAKDRSSSRSFALWFNSSGDFL